MCLPKPLPRHFPKGLPTVVIEGVIPAGDHGHGDGDSTYGLLLSPYGIP